MESKSMIIQKITNALGVREKEVAVLPKVGLMDLIQSVISTQKENRAPFYVLDMGVVESLFQEWTRALPTVRPFYAVKCNPHPAFLGALAALGAGFDCASRAEIEAILALGVSPDRIVYANPCKAECEIKYAASVGVNLTTFDSAGEIEKMRKWHPKCELLIRIKGPEDDGIGAIHLGTKFGALSEEIKPLLLTAQAAGLTVAGVSFHIGSRATQFTAFDGSIGMAKNVFEIAKLLGMPRMRVLNIGGGFTAGTLFPKAASSIKTALQTYFSDEPDLTVIAEPGRFFAATAFTLAATIIGKRIRGEVREYWINDGAYGSMSTIFRDNEYITNVIPLACTTNPENVTGKGETMYGSTVFGPTCDARDMIMKDHALPELEVNDWLVFPSLGAYSAAAASNFNGFSSSAILTHIAYSVPN